MDREKMVPPRKWFGGDSRRQNIKVGHKLIADEDDGFGRWKRGDIGIVKARPKMHTAQSGYLVRWIKGQNAGQEGWIHTSCALPYGR